MKQKQRMFGILAGLVLVLALGVVLAARYTTDKNAADAAADSEENVTISAFSASDLRTLTWIYQEQSATLNRDEDGNWTLEGSDAAVQTTRADSMVTALCSLTSNRAITEADPVQYGIDDPVVTVIYTLADGTENTLYFGDTNPVTGDVYLMETEDSTVYTVSASKCNVFQYTAEELEEQSEDSGAAESGASGASDAQ